MPSEADLVGETWLNGRVLERPGGGVRRYAAELAQHLDCRVARPPSARFPWSARVWEQSALPARARGEVLVNVAHGAPLNHPRNVVIVHDLFALERPDQVHGAFARLTAMQLPAVVRRAAAVVAVSSRVADDVSARFEIQRDAISVAAPGISSPFVPGDRDSAVAKLCVDRRRPIVAALVDPTPRKRADRLLAALDEIATRAPDVQVVAAGTSTPAPFAGARRQRLRLPGVRWLEQPDDVVLAAMYQAADVVVCGSGHEGFGLAPVEAAACGAAVISPLVPSLDANPGAAVVADAEAAALAEAALTLLGDDRARRTQAERGVEATASLRWESTAAVVAETCRRVAT